MGYDTIVQVNEICYNNLMATMRLLQQVFQAHTPHIHPLCNEMQPVIPDDPIRFWYPEGTKTSELK